MIKFRIMSDLHLEFEHGKKELYPVPYIGEDYLVLAGDIHLINRKKQKWFVRLLKERSVIYILGNHEFYNGDFQEIRKSSRQFAGYVNEAASRKGYCGRLHFLDNNTVTLTMVADKEYSVRVVGSTLWSNIHPSATATVQREMNDYHCIKNGDNKLTAHDTTEQYLDNVKFLAGNINAHGADKCLVITHHAPSHKSISQAFERSDLNSAYVSNLEHLMKNADLWIHGHMHESSDYEINGCRVICNPKGYNDQNQLFNPNLSIEL